MFLPELVSSAHHTCDTAIVFVVYTVEKLIDKSFSNIYFGIPYNTRLTSIILSWIWQWTLYMIGNGHFVFLYGHQSKKPSWVNTCFIFSNSRDVYLITMRITPQDDTDSSNLAVRVTIGKFHERTVAQKNCNCKNTTCNQSWNASGIFLTSKNIHWDTKIKHIIWSQVVIEEKTLLGA